jgi:hypothetical protein
MSSLVANYYEAGIAQSSHGKASCPIRPNRPISYTQNQDIPSKISVQENPRGAYKKRRRAQIHARYVCSLYEVPKKIQQCGPINPDQNGCKMCTPLNAILMQSSCWKTNVCARSLQSKDGSDCPPQSGILRPGLMLRLMSMRPHLSSHSLPFSL